MATLYDTDEILTNVGWYCIELHCPVIVAISHKLLLPLNWWKLNNIQNLDALSHCHISNAQQPHMSMATTLVSADIGYICFRSVASSEGRYFVLLWYNAKTKTNVTTFEENHFHAMNIDFF